MSVEAVEMCAEVVDAQAACSEDLKPEESIGSDVHLEVVKFILNLVLYFYHLF